MCAPHERKKLGKNTHTSYCLLRFTWCSNDLKWHWITLSNTVYSARNDVFLVQECCQKVRTCREKNESAEKQSRNNRMRYGKKKWAKDILLLFLLILHITDSPKTQGDGMMFLKAFSHLLLVQYKHTFNEFSDVHIIHVFLIISVLSNTHSQFTPFPDFTLDV